MNEELEKLNNDFNNIEVLEADKITVELIENRGTQQSKLIFNDDPNFSIKLENREYKFKLVEPIYIEKIHLKSKNSLKNIIVSYHTINDETKNIEINNDKSAYISTSIKSIIDYITIKPPKSKKIELEKLEIFGFRLLEVENITQNLKSIENIREEIKREIEKITINNQTQLDEIISEKENLDKLHLELDDEVETLTNKKEELENSLKELDNQIKQISETKNNSENRVKDLNNKEQQLNNSISERNTTLSNLNNDISKKREELKKLESDTSLIAYDVQGYIKTANNHLFWYLGLSIIPWVLIVVITCYIIFGGADLAAVLRVEKDAQLWTIFWSRIPFVIAVGTVIFVAYEVSNIFIHKIMEINQQKLDFQKLGILAKDVSESATQGLDLSDEEKFELRTKLKMEMLKSHLSKDLGKKFEIDIKPNILNKWLNRNNKVTNRINDDNKE
ncbi:hypothetical protein CRU94_03250 [Arcobacter sp. AHV-9/2010]|uniref:hypothetical protein n=1 Tax=Arcobacter sp. AHV-9/2010 TaxID=2021861 RepID=UPI00100AFBF6|nr:hypothetical protein [Arcobacter sp. CECT 9299]RXJ97138.1 hypothetical protein CRU94_03250 [Arcobacter sp. CECT 9299]